MIASSLLANSLFENQEVASLNQESLLFKVVVKEPTDNQLVTMISFLDRNNQLMNYKDVLNSLSGHDAISADFQKLFLASLSTKQYNHISDHGYRVYFPKTENKTIPFEMILERADFFDHQNGDPNAFTGRLTRLPRTATNDFVATFKSNYGTLMICPNPIAGIPARDYDSIGFFSRSSLVPYQQKVDFWKTVAQKILETPEEVYPNTQGFHVRHLHFRLDRQNTDVKTRKYFITP